MKNQIQQLFCFLILLFFIFIAFFYGLSSYVIVDMNEGLYAEVAREMFAAHQYIIPQLNYVPYLEKPPLLYWLIAANYHLFGVSTFAARLIPALGASIICLSLFFFATKIKLAKTGWIAAIILASSIGFIIIGRVVFFDMLLTLWLSLALMSFYLWHQQEKKYYLYAAYVFTALAFLTKGLLPVILAGGIVIVFLALSKTPRTKFLSFFNPIGIGLFLLITLPWPIMAALKLHGFTWDYFVNEQIYRFFNKRIPDDYHTGPIYFYLPRILVYVFPWCLLIPTLFTRWVRRYAPLPTLPLFLWLWLLIPLIFFSLSSAKGDYYMVLSMPALAILIALKINTYIEENNNFTLTILFCLLAIALISTVIYTLLQHIVPITITPLLHHILIYLIIYSAIGLGLILYFRTPILTFLLIAGFTLPLIFFYTHFRSTLQDDYTQIKLAHYIQIHDPQRAVYLYQDYEKISSILFFLEKRLPIIDSVSEDLYFGSHTPQAQDWFITHNQFASIAATRPVYVAILKYKLNDFQTLMKPAQFCTVAQTNTTVLLSNVKNECNK